MPKRHSRSNPSCSGVHIDTLRLVQQAVACGADRWRSHFEKNKRRGSTPAAAASLRRLLTALEFLDGVTNQSTCRPWVYFTTGLNEWAPPNAMPPCTTAAMSAGHRLLGELRAGVFTLSVLFLSGSQRR